MIKLLDSFDFYPFVCDITVLNTNTPVPMMTSVPVDDHWKLKVGVLGDFLYNFIILPPSN